VICPRASAALRVHTLRSGSAPIHLANAIRRGSRQTGRECRAASGSASRSGKSARATMRNARARAHRANRWLAMRRLTMVTEAAGASGRKQSAHTVADRAACLRKSRTSSAVRAPWSARSSRCPAAFRSQSIRDNCLRPSRRCQASVTLGCVIGRQPVLPGMPLNAPERAWGRPRHSAGGFLGVGMDAHPVPSVLVWHPEV
jgi:hypothetical protein